MLCGSALWYVTSQRIRVKFLCSSCTILGQSFCCQFGESTLRTRECCLPSCFVFEFLKDKCSDRVLLRFGKHLHFRYHTFK